MLLGIRNTLKEDLATSSAELVYGERLVFPGQFISTTDLRVSPATEKTASGFLQALQRKIRSFLPQATAHHGRRPNQVPKNIQDCQYVFIRKDMRQQPFQSLYEGPYRVLSSDDKVFKVQRGDHTLTVSIDRIKPANLNKEQPFRPGVVPKRGRPKKSHLHS